jgi:hypothetical protein
MAILKRIVKSEVVIGTKEYIQGYMKNVNLFTLLIDEIHKNYPNFFDQNKIESFFERGRGGIIHAKTFSQGIPSKQVVETNFAAVFSASDVYINIYCNSLHLEGLNDVVKSFKTEYNKKAGSRYKYIVIFPDTEAESTMLGKSGFQVPSNTFVNEYCQKTGHDTNNMFMYLEI